MANPQLAQLILNLMSDGKKRYTIEVHTHLGLPKHRYTSVITILSRMRKQGVLESEKVDGRRYYWAAKPRIHFTECAGERFEGMVGTGYLAIDTEDGRLLEVRSGGVFLDGEYQGELKIEPFNDEDKTKADLLTRFMRWKTTPRKGGDKQ